MAIPKIGTKVTFHDRSFERMGREEHTLVLGTIVNFSIGHNGLIFEVEDDENPDRRVWRDNNEIYID